MALTIFSAIYVRSELKHHDSLKGATDNDVTVSLTTGACYSHYWWYFGDAKDAGHRRLHVAYVKSLAGLEIDEHCNLKTWVGNKVIRLGYRYMST